MSLWCIHSKHNYILSHGKWRYAGRYVLYTMKIILVFLWSFSFNSYIYRGGHSLPWKYIIYLLFDTEHKKTNYFIFIWIRVVYFKFWKKINSFFTLNSIILDNCVKYEQSFGFRQKKFPCSYFIIDVPHSGTKFPKRHENKISSLGWAKIQTGWDI